MVRSHFKAMCQSGIILWRQEQAKKCSCGYSTTTGSFQWFSGEWPLAIYWMFKNYSLNGPGGRRAMVGGRIDHYPVWSWRCYCLPLSSNRVSDTREASVSKCSSIRYPPIISPDWNWCPRNVGDAADEAKYRGGEEPLEKALVVITRRG